MLTIQKTGKKKLPSANTASRFDRPIVAIVGQEEVKPTSNREGASSVPGLAQWVKDPVLL